MRKDPTAFRERFERWKQGEQVYENGLALPAYEDGKLPKFKKGLTPHKKSEVNTNEATYNPEEDLYTARYTVPEVTITGDKSKRVYHSHAPRTSGVSKNQYKLQTGDLLGAMTTGMNVLSPSQWWGAIRDAEGLQDGFNRLMRGNSGFVTQKYAQEHPYVSLGANLAGDVLLMNAASKSANLARALDRGFVNNKNILNQSENTMTRYVGTGDSGYKDALINDVIRGNMNPPRFSANELAHIRRRFGRRLSESDFRDLASNNIRSKEQFDRINEILKPKTENRKIGRFLTGKDYNLGNSWEEYLSENKQNQIYQAEKAYMDALSKSPEINDWIKNWAISTDPVYPRGHKLPTFALSNEKLTNSLQFPGDYAVQIKNADKYARTATTFGHFAEHPTTYRPMSPFENDVDMFVRKDGLLTGHKYMVKIPKSKMAADRLKYLQNEGYSVNPTLRKGIGIDYNKLMNINTSDINLLNAPIITSDLIDYETRSQQQRNIRGR